MVVLAAVDVQALAGDSPRHLGSQEHDRIGDLVLSLTVVRALKRAYPEAEIDLLAVPDYWQDVVRGILIIAAVAISSVVDRR